MENLFSRSDEVRVALLNNDQALAAAIIREYLNEEDNIPINIAITGESGSGKSSFVNAIRGLKDDDEGAAQIGEEETTMEATPYHHPNFPSVTFWDLPGMGTMKFPAAKYLKKVKFERFDFFIIISDRFRENDVKLAKEIKKKKMKFFFVRSKIDDNLREKRRTQREFSEERTLAKIRETCIQGLLDQGFDSPQVFLISSRELHLYDFPLLAKTLRRELPELKREAFQSAMPNTSLEMIDRKKKAFQSKIKYFATLSAAVAGVPVPGLSVAVDVGLLVGVVTRYVFGFGLNISSLKKMASYSGVSYEKLKEVITSPFVATEISSDLVLRIIAQTAILPVLMTAEEWTRFIPILGIPASMGLSFTFTYKALNIFLDVLAEDARKVFKKTCLKSRE